MKDSKSVEEILDTYFPDALPKAIRNTVAALNILLEEARQQSRAKLAKSILLNGGLPAHTKQYLESIIQDRLAELKKDKQL